MIVSLIGYRGSGKSTVGRHLAEGWGWPFADSDDEVERESSSTIAEIFAASGEAEFRNREAACITRLLESPQLVLALGGGAILRDSTAEAVTARGPLVYLVCPPEVLAARIASDCATAARRPRLTPLAPDEEIAHLLRRRDPIYRRWAQICVDATGDPRRVARHIAESVASLRE